MGKAALLAIAGFIIVLTYYNMTASTGEAGAIRATTNHQLSVLARNAAIAGYNRAKQMVADEGGLASFTGSGMSFDGAYGEAEYETSITSDGSSATIRSIGESTNGVDDVNFHVEAVVGWTSGTSSSSVPPFMKYALITEENLLLNGHVRGSVDDEDSELNANFHTNGDLQINGNASRVAGFGTFAGTGKANPKKALTGTFRPNFNPDDLETAFRTPAVEMPTFDAAEFLSNVTVDQTSTGTVLIKDDMDLGGTREDPYIWYVQGDLIANGNPVLDGYVMFVVEGDITLNGTLDAGTDAEESTIALYAGEDVILNGNVQVHGQIYAEGNVTFNGTPDVYGSVATHSKAVLNGTPNIHYRPASPALTEIFSDGDMQLELISYFEY